MGEVVGQGRKAPEGEWAVLAGSRQEGHCGQREGPERRHLIRIAWALWDGGEYQDMYGAADPLAPGSCPHPLHFRAFQTTEPIAIHLS